MVVYITDRGASKSRIIKLTPDLKLICEVPLRAVSQVRGVTVVGDEVVVCDRVGSVQVYTKDLMYERQIGGPGLFKDIYGISSDEGGNLYISDAGKSCIHVFNNGGLFLRSFGHGVGDFKTPIGVHTAGKYVYVTNYRGHYVSVFTTEGEHVTSFGHLVQEGTSGEGDFRYPWGLCVDRDGFVYVCDEYNHRVQIF